MSYWNQVIWGPWNSSLPETSAKAPLSRGSGNIALYAPYAYNPHGGTIGYWCETTFTPSGTYTPSSNSSATQPKKEAPMPHAPSAPPATTGQPHFGGAYCHMCGAKKKKATVTTVTDKYGYLTENGKVKYACGTTVRYKRGDYTLETQWLRPTLGKGCIKLAASKCDCEE